MNHLSDRRIKSYKRSQHVLRDCVGGIDAFLVNYAEEDSSPNFDRLYNHFLTCGFSPDYCNVFANAFYVCELNKVDLINPLDSSKLDILDLSSFRGMKLGKIDALYEKFKDEIIINRRV